jgi:hypothetical protein
MLYYCLFVFLVFVLPVLIVIAAASYFTGLICRFAHRRHWHIGWQSGLLGAVAGGACGIGLVLLGISLQPGSWGKVDLSLFLFVLCLVGLAIAILPAQLVVRRYRKKFTNANPVA